MNTRFWAIALSTVFSPCLLPQPMQAQTPASAAIAACYGNPAACAVIGAAAGTWLIWRNGPKLLCTYGTCVNKIRSADEPYHSQIIDYVWGDSPEQAAQRCQAIARQNGLRYVAVRRTSQRGKKWECHVDNL